MKAPPVNVAEEEQKVLQKQSLQKRSTKKRSAKKVYKQKSAEKYTWKNIRQQRLDLQKKLNTDSKERSVT